MTTTVSDSLTAPAREKLDVWVREVVAWHFDPARDLQPAAGQDTRVVVQTRVPVECRAPGVQSVGELQREARGAHAAVNRLE